MSQKFSETLISTPLKPIDLFFGPFIQINTFDFGDPRELSECGRAVETQEDGMGGFCPLPARFAAMHAMRVGLNLEQFKQ